jgi:ATP-dependent RNA helicase RhlE
MSFNTLGLSRPLLSSIQHAGYTTPTPIQSAAIPPIVEGHDLIGIAQTGTGKTAAFTLPLLERMLNAPPQQGTRRTPQLLIVAPTRELAAQIEENVRLFSRGTQFRTVTIFGGVGESPQIDALRRGADIVVATPGRLLDLMQQRHVALDRVRYVVLDEADRMLDMGFLPQIKRVMAAVPRERQTLLFSATLSKDIESVTSAFLRNPKIVEIGRRANPAEGVAQFLYPVPKSRKIDLLLRLLNDQSLDSVLVFSRTKHGADKIARKLTQCGIPTAALHSNRSQGQRIAALKAFKDGSARVLVATDIAARGIDVEGISHVINFDFPMHSEDYVHRIGRTGRAAAIGDAISFVTPEDEPNVRDLERMIRKTIERTRLDGFDYTDAAPRPQQYGARPQRPQHAPRPQQAQRSSRPAPAQRPSAPPQSTRRAARTRP